jgi:hypothetical protein
MLDTDFRRMLNVQLPLVLPYYKLYLLKQGGSSLKLLAFERGAILFLSVVAILDKF